MTKRRILFLALLIPSVLAVAVLPAAAASTVVLHYIGTQKTGTVAKDASGFHNRGVLHHVRLTGHAYRFNARSSYIRTAASTSLNPGRSRYSYTVSINIPTTVTYAHDFSLVRRGSSKFAGAYYKMEMVYNRDSGHMRLVCAFRDSERERESVSTNGQTLNDGVWHTLTCQKTAKSVSLIKDGVVHTKPAALGDLSSAQPLFFGAEQVGPTEFWEHFPGRMKDITVTKG